MKPDRNSLRILAFCAITFLILSSCERGKVNPISNPLDPKPVDGISAAYVKLDNDNVIIEQYSPQGSLVIKIIEDPKGGLPPLRTGSIVTVDLDTMGYLRKVTDLKTEGNKITMQTDQAYLTDVFVDKDFKLNTSLIEPGQIVDSKGSLMELSEAFTDKDGFVHPCEVIYLDSSDKYIVFDATTMKSDGVDIKILDFLEDFSGTDIYGSEGSNVHLYISEGHASLISDAIMEFDFDFEGDYDEHTQVAKGDLKTFSFYLDSKAEFQTKLELDMTRAFSKSNSDDPKKLKDFRKKTVKFMVGPVPVWISFNCDIYGVYDLNADASLHADWGFQSTHQLTVGDIYDAWAGTHTPISDFTPLNVIYPLNISGEVNLGARFEIYPRIEVMVYSLFGPFAEIVPFVEGNYNAAIRSQITPAGPETFLAWDAGVDLGLDFRIGAKLDFIGTAFDEEFGPKEITCFSFPLWNSPETMEIASSVPSESTVNSTIPLKIRVKDNLGFPVRLCPVYFSGEGSFSKYFVFTDMQGYASVNWTLSVTTGGNKKFTAKIFDAEGEVVDELSGQINVSGPKPVAAFSASEVVIEIGQSVQFTDQSTNNPTGWNWSFGDGGTSTSKNPSHTYSSVGSYTVRLTATNSFGSDDEIKANYITVNPKIPVYLSSVVENATPSRIDMTYSVNLANIIPSVSAFAVRINSSARSISSVTISGTRVYLNLSSPIVYGNVVTVSYTKPSVNPLQNTAGGQAASISSQNVTNRVLPVASGKISGIVRDAATSAALTDVTASAYLSSTFIASATTQNDGRYEISVPGNSGYRVVFSKTGYLSAEYKNVNVNVNQTTILEPVLQIDQSFSGSGAIGGTIKNALDGTGISGVSLRLRSGINSTSGTIISSISTGTTGLYTFSNIPGGNYTVEATKTGFNTTFFNVVCLGGRTTGNQNATMSPTLGSGETRIVLTWGSTPSDLDSHLTGPLSGGTRFHMYYIYDEGRSPWPSIVTLDLDDTQSYGPETTTLLTQISGIYRFSVHDYSNMGSSNSYSLSNSGAQVKVYQNSGLVATFNVPPNTGGTLWTVFEMSNNVITPKNQMSYVSTPSGVSKSGYVSPDIELFRSLPKK